MSLREEQMGTYYMGGRKENYSGLILPEDALAKEFAKLKEEKEAKEFAAALIKAEETKQKELEEKLQTLEMLPTGFHIFIQPYPVNPYRKTIQNGILIDDGANFTNADSGEPDKLQYGIGCAKVIEVGPDCKWVRAGDDIYYDCRGQRPVPFMNLGYWVVVEQQVVAYLNEKLTERKNNPQNV